MEKTNKELLEDLGIDLKRISNSGKTTCPKCSSERKKKTDPCLSVNVIEGIYHCHNCHWSGKVFTKTEYVPQPKTYVQPEFVNTTECSKITVDWFFQRGITQATLRDAKVTESVEWMPGVEGNHKTINFNYFRNGILVNTKFRGKKKSFRLVKDAELIMYGLDNIRESETVIIVEGEMDALSVWESGIKECISVPNGASISSNANLQYLDNCIDYFANKKKIIIATDNDDPGFALREELARRLGYHRCFKVNLEGEKDANDYLIKYGATKLKERFADHNLIEFPISGVITTDMIWDNVKGYIKNGLSRGDITGKLNEFDELVSFVPGHLMVLTGIPNHGKSPFALMLMISLSISKGWKWGFFTPEHKPLEIFVTKICETLLGKRLRKGVTLTENEDNLLFSFMKDHFYFIDPEEGDNKLDTVIEKAKELVLRKGIRGLVIDPWNKIEHQMASGESETMYISRQLDKIIKFNQTYHVFGIVIAHPTKIKKKPGKEVYEVPSLYDIAGSSNWFNKPDWGITFYRNYETGNNEIYVQKAKWDNLGKQGMAEVKYNVNNSRFSDLHAAHDNSNWLIPDAVQPDFFSGSLPSQFDNPLNEFNNVGNHEIADAPF